MPELERTHTNTHTHVVWLDAKLVSYFFLMNICFPGIKQVGFKRFYIEQQSQLSYTGDLHDSRKFCP